MGISHPFPAQALPTVSLAAPAAAVVGAPNVGKSTLVGLLSSSAPAVADYAFTTRGVGLGHVYGAAAAAARAPPLLGQVLDAPGLLRRGPGEHRNDLEKLTLATLDHLPTAVVFVADLSGAAGDAVSSPADQLALRAELRARYPRRPWVDVVAKADLYAAAKDPAPAPDGALLVSARDGTGVAELRARLEAALAAVAAAVATRRRPADA